MIRRSLFFAFSILQLFSTLRAINPKVEPPFWWAGMKNQQLQLLIYAEDISGCDVSFDCEHAVIDRLIRTTNPNYLFIDITVLPSMVPGVYHLEFFKNRVTLFCYEYEFKQRIEGSAARGGVDASDAIYLIMPDRFANGDPDNDCMPGMFEKVDRNKPNGRHGGDLKGIQRHLSYIKDLGFTAIWINPVLENNMPQYSYHGYAITDFYAIDPRLGTLDDYIALIADAQSRGIKVIKDMVFNHCGTGHYWVKDPPAPDWIHHWNEFTRTNYRATTFVDPHRSDYDYKKMVQGWFDTSMPDLNQDNPMLAKYLIQNSIWWVELTGLDGIRMDTQPYPYKEFMADWGKAVLNEYHNFYMVGEAWLTKASLVAYYQKNALNHDGYNSNLPGVFDFPVNAAMLAAFNEKDGWDRGTARLYEALAEDFLYPNPYNLVTFLDNHDKSRYFTIVGEDINKLKMALSFLFTTRGIPSVYYGTELLMTGWEQPEHGEIRKDFPGGWPGDKTNAFDASGRTSKQNEAFNFIRKLLEIRKKHHVLHFGSLTHFIPNDGIYVYFRHNEDDCVMVIMNNNEIEKELETKRFAEILGKYSITTNLMADKPFKMDAQIKVPAKSATILGLTN
ncbi:MAG: glycoside hydrolase family 13 protein [Bacteroidales bacterium]|nr:glycoside hydrolase family 13 protein [Bacteroidales bacterium]